MNLLNLIQVYKRKELAKCTSLCSHVHGYSGATKKDIYVSGLLKNLYFHVLACLAVCAWRPAGEEAVPDDSAGL